MAKNKLKDSFYWLGKNGQEDTVDLSNRSVMQAVKQVKDCLKKTPYGKSNFMFIAGKGSLVIGTVNEEGERNIFVARDYWEADYIPDYGWMKVEDDTSL